MNKSPKLMDFSKMQDIFSPTPAEIREHLYIDNHIAIIHSSPKVFKLMMQQNPPFIINDHRLGIIVRGEIKAIINLVEKRIIAGMLLFIGPGTIITPLEISPDLQIFGFGIANDFPLPFPPGQVPPAFNGQVRDFQLPVEENDITMARQILETIWQLVHQKDYNPKTLGSLVAAQMQHYNGAYQQHFDNIQNTQSREQTIFDRFIYLINQHATQEHQIRFYADKMCLTERYLGTVIRQASGTTAKEWIDRSLLNHIKAELRHTDKSVAQIAEEMNFPNPSFFSKYFKRLTNMTPAEFRGI
ncbi:MAG: AraC family transcriptional regulator [Prevotella sp.]|nr:AraC family transcriptional regulator [Prevotella sp.]